MTAEHPSSRYTLGEEIANSVIHGVGIVLGIAGLGVLTAFASLYGDAWHIVGCSVFGAALILLYTASTPVSYTHLDVYKRQRRRCAATKRGCAVW